jgi:hypothetical protein
MLTKLVDNMRRDCARRGQGARCGLVRGVRLKEPNALREGVEDLRGDFG